MENLNKIPQNNQEEDIDMLEFRIQEIKDELTWQFNTLRIDELKKQKRELEENIKNIKGL